MVSSAISATHSFLICVLSIATAAAPQEHQPAAHLLTSTPDKGLVVLSIPETSAADQTVSVHVVPRRAGLTSFPRPLGVYKGHILVLQANMVAAIDLQSGTIRRVTRGTEGNFLNVKYAAGHLHFVTSKRDEVHRYKYELHHLDLNKMETTKSCDLLLNHWANKAGNDFSMSVSLDGTRVAIAETSLEHQSETATGKARFRFVVCDVAKGVVMKSDYKFSGIFAMTGASFSMLRPPQSIWSGNDSLIVADEQRFDSRIVADQPKKLFQLTIKNANLKGERLSSKPVLTLPKLHLAIGSPWFFQDIFGKPGLTFQPDNRYSVDLKNSKLIEYSSLSKHYQISTSIDEVSSQATVTLLHHGQKLATGLSPYRIFPSPPNGSRAAWLPDEDQITRGGYSEPKTGPFDLKLHDPINGTRTIFQGTSFYSCTWISNENMVRGDAFDKLVDLAKELPAKPKAHKDSRPSIETAIALKVTTDKKTYMRHEQVRAVLEIKNLQDKPLRIKTNRILGGGQELQAMLFAKRGRTDLEIYDRFDNQPIVETLEIPPGKSITLNRNFEVKYLGVQKLRLQSTNGKLGRGTVAAEAEFEVLKETTAELLQQKFDRLMAKCLIQFGRGANQVTPSVFWQLGDEATPLLIDYLENCHNGKLRESLGRGLSGGKFDSIKPYLQSLLESDLNNESKTLRDQLWRFASNRAYFGEETFKEARKLFYEAAKHHEADIRLMFVKRMSGTFDDGIKEQMLLAAKDEDPSVAMVAARHLAIRSESDLATWFRETKDNPTRLRFLATKSITQELQATWNLDHGELPSEIKAETDNMQALEQYESTMDNWIEWFADNPRISNSYFAKARAKAKVHANR